MKQLSFVLIKLNPKYRLIHYFCIKIRNYAGIASPGEDHVVYKIAELALFLARSAGVQCYLIFVAG